MARTIRGTRGDGVIVGGRGYGQLSGDLGFLNGLGSDDRFVFRAGDGADAIFNFGDGPDVLDLRGHRGVDSAQDVLDHAIR